MCNFWSSPLALVQSFLIALLPASAGLFPRLVPFLVAALGLLLFIDVGIRKAARESLASTTGSALAGLAFASYALVSASWAEQPAFGARSGLLVAAMVICAMVLGLSMGPSMAHLSSEWRNRFVRAVPIGASFGVAYVLVELLTDFALTKYVLSTFPELIGARRKGLAFRDDTIAAINPYFLNRNVAALVLIAPVAVFIGRLWLRGPIRDTWTLLFALCMVVMVFASRSETAKLALVAAGFTFLTSLKWPRQTGLLLALALVLAVIFAVPLARLPHAVGLQDAEWLSVGARQRVSIWHHTAEAVGENPVLGVGIQSTRFLGNGSGNDSDEESTEPSADTTRKLGWHAHNNYLQVWFELGAVGALLLLGLGLAVLGKTMGLSSALLPTALATYAALMVLAASGWSLWQAWYLGTVAAVVAFVSLAAAEWDLRQASGPGVSGREQ